MAANPGGMTNPVEAGPMTLENGVVFCEVKSWISGQRLVSLPFSDHCDPLIRSPAEHAHILTHIREHIVRTPCKYAEVRPLSIGDPDTFKQTTTYKYGCSDDRFSRLGGTPFLPA